MRRQGWLTEVTGKTTFTTKTKTNDSHPVDRVQRRFQAEHSRQLWFADITYVATWGGFAYLAFVTDVFSRKIVGWSVSSTLKTDMLPLQALNLTA
jgi:putative transposase